MENINNYNNYNELLMKHGGNKKDAHSWLTNMKQCGVIEADEFSNITVFVSQSISSSGRGSWPSYKYNDPKAALMGIFNWISKNGENFSRPPASFAGSLSSVPICHPTSSIIAVADQIEYVNNIIKRVKELTDFAKNHSTVDLDSISSTLEEIRILRGIKKKNKTSKKSKIKVIKKSKVLK